MDFFAEVVERSYEQAKRNRRLFEKLQFLREAKQIPREIVARRLATTPESVTDLELRAVNPTLQELHSYAVAIGVSIDYDVKDLDEQDTTFGWDGSLNTGEKKRIKDNA
ncbi:helix-turn-helix domain-containing protein [Actinotignum sp. GS-2025f]|uniref:helix-turn-helix domain-containing protein n=1 Tax=unclassified Actinotignum TaxID=2632702 RepID=UPI002A814E57|nr:helix-turn-helix transcriptional regulator [Actinotignum sp. SLA_B059]MDY5127876.1 helix-turn-helix transcriptional regulator [Actinotignum sp. SLA_B059]